FGPWAPDAANRRASFARTFSIVRLRASRNEPPAVHERTGTEPPGGRWPGPPQGPQPGGMPAAAPDLGAEPRPAPGTARMPRRASRNPTPGGVGAARSEN